MAFEIYIPENLKFPDYIAVLQTTRTWADGYDRKVNHNLRSTAIRLTQDTGHRKALCLAGQLYHC